MDEAAAVEDAPPLDAWERQEYLEYLITLAAMGLGVMMATMDTSNAQKRALVPLAQSFDDDFANDLEGYQLKRFLEICKDRHINNRGDIVACLVDKYAVDFNHRNAAGRSALEIAAVADCWDVCEVLVRRGATLSAYALEHYGAGIEEEAEEAEQGQEQGQAQEQGQEEEEEGQEVGTQQPGPLSEEAKDERRAALLLLLPELLRRAEELTPFPRCQLAPPP